MEINFSPVPAKKNYFSCKCNSMIKYFTTLFLSVLTGYSAFSQKKPLDHTVYDSWQSIGERYISNDGQWVVYSVNPQEGDNELVVQSADASYKKIIPRGYNAAISADSRYLVFKIRPLFSESRDAKIKKKRPDDMPKDSLAFIELGKDSIWKQARVKNYKMPEKESGWVAYHLEKAIEKKSADSKKPGISDKKILDSLNRVIDSLHTVIASLPVKKKKNKNEDGSEIFVLEEMTDAEGDEIPPGPVNAGTDLVVRNLSTGKQKTYNNVLEYFFSERGNRLVIEQAKNPKDSLSKPSVTYLNLESDKSRVISSGGNEFKNFVMTEDGSQVAYLAERNARPKELQKFFRLWHYQEGMDSAMLIADKNAVGMNVGMTVSEHSNLSFSKSGKRIFFGVAPIQAPKDTSLIEIDLVKVDVWHYNDDYLQPVQLRRLQRDLETNFLAVFNLEEKTLHQLANREMPVVYQTNEGDGQRFVGVTDFGKRIESQWMGGSLKDLYEINVNDGKAKLIKENVNGLISSQYVSPGGKYIVWYDFKSKNYFAWDGETSRNISAKIKFPLWDEEHDSPSDPVPYGIMGWSENDEALYLYDRFDIWKVDPTGKQNPVNVTQGKGRQSKTSYRYGSTDRDEKFIKGGQAMLFRTFNNITKESGLANSTGDAGFLVPANSSKFSYGNVTKSKNTNRLIYTRENFSTPADIFIANENNKEIKLSSINLQQKDYNWGTAEIYKWKALDGKTAEGVLYKPENFDSTKNYPMIMYFYETHSNTLYDYIDPTPTGSRLNVPFFVSRGYVVFSPDIHYTIGYPAKSAYNYVVSAAKDLGKKKWIDEKNIGIQGQSWGGIQVAQLVTMTDMFKAAWAGAPVANMTSAYGGIRWESGVNRQFQYEKTQSRIGATLWEKPNLYIENSPLFHLPKVKTPLVIMANDADGAVPWYQGIELFTAMRRLNKKVWMLNYNGEAHNLVERKNKKDISIREQQYFDWLLKGEKPPKWITEGVPAINKGKDWGLQIEE